MAYTILEQVKLRLEEYSTEDSEVTFEETENDPRYEQLIAQATAEVTERRRYPSSYTDDMISEDLERFEGVIVNLVVYDCSQAGEAYMSSYGENSVTRTWVEREKLLARVYPLAEII